jgi:tetratricopeptide (TPR) repeat protein
MIANPPGESVSPSIHFSSRRSNPWFFAMLSCFLLLVVFGIRLINDLDLGYHLKSGQWIMENLSFPSHDTFTYTVSDRAYVDLHWMYQTALYLVHRAGGYSWLTVAHVLLIVLAFVLTFARLRCTGSPYWMCVILLGVALLGCELRFRVRPEILTWVLMGLTLWILEQRMGRGRNLLFLLPLIQVVWINAEGLFLIGWVLAAFFLASGWFHDGKLDKALLKYSGLAAAACLLNPYFLRGVLFPFELMNTLGSDVFANSINELKSPWTMAKYQTFLPEWTLLSYKLFSFFLLLLMLFSIRKRKLHDFLMAGSFFYLSCNAQRNLSLFMLACVPLAASCWKDLKWEKLEKFQAAVFPRPAAAWVFTLFMLGLCLRVMTGAYYVSERRSDRFGLGLDAHKQPVQAASFLVENRLDGRILNHMNLGGWLDWKGPQKTFVDGRLEVMGEKFYAEFNASSQSGGLAALLEKYGIEIIIFNPNHASQWLHELEKMPDWRPVYLDEAAVIFLGKAYAPQVPVLDDERVLANRGISPAIRQEAPGVLRMPRPSSWACFWEDFYRPSRYSQGLADIATYYRYSRRFDLAEAVYLKNIRNTRGRYYDLYFNLGSLYFDIKKYNEARICMQRVLKEVPDSKYAHIIMSRLPPP